jgi:hypothetical protein
MSETEPDEIDTESPVAAERIQKQNQDESEGNGSGAGADGEPMVTDPAKAGETEQTGSWGTGTPGGSNVTGLQDIAPIESELQEKYGSAPEGQTTREESLADETEPASDEQSIDHKDRTNG